MKLQNKSLLPLGKKLLADSNKKLYTLAAEARLFGGRVAVAG